MVGSPIRPPAPLLQWLERWAPFVVFALALAIRLAHLFAIRSAPFVDIMIGDAQIFDAWAHRVAAGDWYGSEVFYQAPLYPYAMAIIYKLGGHEPFAIRVVQAFVGASSCALLAVAGRWFFSPRAGLVSGILLSLYAPAVFFDGIVQKTSLALFFVCLLLTLLGRQTSDRRLWWPAATGVVLAALVLLRENMLILYPLILAWMGLGFSGEAMSRRVSNIAVLIIGSAIVLTPIGLRNQTIGGEFLLTTSNLGPNFFIGNNKDAQGNYQPLRPRRGDPVYEATDARELAEEALGRELTPAAVSRYWLGRSFDYMKSEPAAWLRLMLKKWMMVWNANEYLDMEGIEIYRDHSRPLRYLGSWYHFGALLPLAVVGVVRTWPRRRELWLLYAILLATAASVALFFVMARFRFTMVPVLTLFAGVALIELGQLVSTEGRRQLRVAVLAGGAVLIACNWPIASQAARSLSYTNFAATLKQRGEIDAAAILIARGLEEDPDSPLLIGSMADVLRRRGRYSEAANHYLQVVDTHPDPRRVLLQLGTSLARAERSKEAEEVFRRMLRLDPADADAHGYLGNLLQIRGRHQEALAHYQQAVEGRPDWLSIRLNYARLLRTRGNIPEAIEQARRALALDANDSQARKLVLELERIGR